MLTKDLLRYKMAGEYAKIRFVPANDPGMLSLASALIDLFENAVHCTREDLEEQLSPVVNGSQDILLTRGLVKLLMDRSTFSGRNFDQKDLPAQRHTLFLRSMELLENPECPENPFTFRDQAGMSEASIMPKQAAEMGISLGKLFGMTLENLF